MGGGARTTPPGHGANPHGAFQPLSHVQGWAAPHQQCREQGQIPTRHPVQAPVCVLLQAPGPVHQIQGAPALWEGRPVLEVFLLRRVSSGTKNTSSGDLGDAENRGGHPAAIDA